jgi:amidase
MRGLIPLWVIALVSVVSCSQEQPSELALEPTGWLAKTLPEISRGLDAGEITSEALVRAYLTRIERVDRSGPTLQSVLAINVEAIDEARSLDVLRSKGQVLGPLHGVPVLLKDNIESKENLPTTAGSFALAENISLKDAPLVAGLRAAGVLIVGKTNLSEWANFRAEDSMSGWSAVGGQVKNPHMLDRNPCGSSAGSAAATAASLAAASVGTETNGSIICPASINGIVGFKPTVGLVSQQGIVPISPTQDTAGPMTKTVTGAAMLLDAMDNAEVDYVAGLSTSALQGKRVGVVRYAVGQDRSILPLFEAALLVLQSQGAELVDIDQAYPLPDRFRQMTFDVLRYEFKASINAYLKAAPPGVTARSLAALIEFNQRHPRELTLFDQSIFDASELMGDLTDPAFVQAREVTFKATREEGIDRYLAEYELDVLIAPSGVPSPRIDPINGDVWPPFVGIGWMAAVAGYPHATVPMGVVAELPVGLSFIGSQGADQQVLAAAFAYEQASQLRPEPGYLTDAAALDYIGANLAAP